MWVWHEVGVPSKLFQELLMLLGAALSPKPQGVAINFPLQWNWERQYRSWFK